MKKITSGILILLVIAFSGTSCKKNKDTVAPATTSTPEAAYASQKNKKEVFTYNANRDTTLEGTGGTRISIGAGTLCTLSGQPVTGNVTVELKEVTKFSDLILNNTSTSCNGKLFKSAGIFYISAKQNGNPLMLAADANYLIEIKSPKGTIDGMTVLTGADSAGVILWKPVKNNANSMNARITDTNPDFLSDSNAYYANTNWQIVKQTDSYIVNANSFGWVATGFYVSAASECQLNFTMDAAYNSSYTCIYYTIPSMSVIGRTAVDSYFSSYISQSIPDQTAIKIIGLTYSNNKYYISIQDYFVNCSTQQPFHLNFQEIAESDIEPTLQSINI